MGWLLAEGKAVPANAQEALNCGIPCEPYLRSGELAYQRILSGKNSAISSW